MFCPNEALPAANGAINAGPFDLTNWTQLGASPIPLVDLAGLLTNDGTGTLTWTNPSSLPTGGTSGQLLTKNSSTDGDASWVTLAGSTAAPTLPSAQLAEFLKKMDRLL